MDKLITIAILGIVSIGGGWLLAHGLMRLEMLILGLLQR
jgi:hypothetical protein